MGLPLQTLNLGSPLVWSPANTAAGKLRTGCKVVAVSYFDQADRADAAEADSFMVQYNVTDVHEPETIACNRADALLVY